jgi:aspartate aminotransferase
MELPSRLEKVAPSATLTLNALVKQMTAEGKSIINLTVGEPDFDTPKHIKESAIKAIKDGFTKYTPPEGILSLREAIQNKLAEENSIKYTPNEIIVTAGAKDALYLLFQVILNEGDEVIIPSPYWVSYPQQVRLAGGTPKTIPTSGNFSFPMDDFQKTISNKTKAVIINTPCNPSGAVFDETTLRKIAEIARGNNILIVSDEIYENFIYEGKHASIASFSPEIKNITITINGFSKTYAMTGWRIGYLAAPEQIVKGVKKIQSQSTSCASSISQKAALGALQGPQDAIKEMVNEFRRRRDYLIEQLKKMEFFSIAESPGTFYLFPSIRLNEKFSTSENFCMHLLKENGVGTVHGSAFGKEGHIRISYATKMENLEEAISRIEKTLNK